MHTIRVIPCLDVDGGRVVKGVQFVDIKDAGDPVELAVRYNDQGADEVVFLDITASSDQRATMIDVVKRAADCLFIPLTVGGGIRTLADARAMLRAGADKIGVNTAAIHNPGLISEIADEFGAQCVVVAIDMRITKFEYSESGYEVVTHGGRRPTGRDGIAWAKEAVARGAGELLVTSMDRDGTKDGYDCALLKALASEVSVPIIASGGVGTLDHFAEGARAGATGLLAASVFHFGAVSVADVKTHLQQQAFAVRPVKNESTTHGTKIGS